MNINMHADIHPMVVKGSDAWMVSGDNNFLYKIDLKKWQIELLSTLKEETDQEKNNWRGNIAKAIYKNKLICLPDRNNKIVLYDILSGKEDYIEMPKGITSRWICEDYWIEENKMYFYARGASAIYYLDFETKNVFLYDTLTFPNIVTDCFSIEETFYFITEEKSLYLYTYNIINKLKTKQLILEDNSNSYQTMCFDGVNFWFSGKRKKVLVWCANTKTIKEIPIKDIDIVEYDWKNMRIIKDEDNFTYKIFMKQFIVGKYIVFMPYESNQVIYIDRDTYKVDNMKLPVENLTSELMKKQSEGVLTSYIHMFEFITGEKKIGIYSFVNKKHYIFDFESLNVINEIGDFKLVISKIYAELCLKSFYIEDNEMKLIDLIDCMIC